jgi:hypothetical protein
VGPGPVGVVVVVVVFSSSPPIMSIAAEEDEHTIKAMTPMIIGVLDIFIIYTDFYLLLRVTTAVGSR